MKLTFQVEVAPEDNFFEVGLIRRFTLSGTIDEETGIQVSGSYMEEIDGIPGQGTIEITGTLQMLLLPSPQREETP